MVIGNIIFLNGAVQVTGIHTGYETTYFAGRAFGSGRPQFRYFDRQGNQLTNATKAFPPDNLLTVGEAVMLIMDPDKPSHIEIEAEYNPLMPGGVFIGLGLLILLLPRWINRQWMKRRRKKIFQYAQKSQARKYVRAASSVMPERRQNESPTVRRMR